MELTTHARTYLATLDLHDSERERLLDKAKEYAQIAGDERITEVVLKRAAWKLDLKQRASA